MITSRTARRHAVVALMAAALVAGCGSDKEDEGAATATTGAQGEEPSTTTTAADDEADETDETDEEASGDACDIVSDEVVTEVLGIEVARREPNEDQFGRSCIKGNERSGDPSQFTFVSVSVLTGGGSTVVDQFRTEADAAPVEGLGDDAVFVPSAGVLVIVDGEDSIQVQVVEGGIPGTQEQAVTVAEDVLGRR